MPLPDEDKKKLQVFLEKIECEAQHFVGYPCNDLFDYTELNSLFRHSINNVGDPFVESSYSMNSHPFEAEVIRFFAGIFHASDGDVWGYVTHGGTEGNMYGLYLARELHPLGVVYYSEDTHYSVQKILRLVGLRSIMIRSQPSGEIDYEDLSASLRLHRDVPAIIVANIGTTMKGALDDAAKIVEALDVNRIRARYIHCDAALSGMILPFVEGAPAFDFRLPIDSISVSGHKMIGSPMPCGIVLAKRTTVDRIARSVEYVGTLDTTLSGSRNGITPVFLWYAIRSLQHEGFRRLVADCLEKADYTQARLNAAGLNAWRNPHSITVIFDRPPKEVLDQWSIAVHGPIAHVITMPHVTKRQIDALAEHITRARPDANGCGETR